MAGRTKSNLTPAAATTCAPRPKAVAQRYRDALTDQPISLMTTVHEQLAVYWQLGVRSDLVKHPELRSNVVERLKIIGKQAEKAGVIIGVETELPACNSLSAFST